MSPRMFEVTALIGGSFLSGAMMSISMVGVPALRDTGTQAATILHQWRRIYHYGHSIMPVLALSTCALYGCAALQRRSKRQKSWALLGLAGVATVCIIPFTLIIMAPVNETLFQLESSIAANPGWIGTEDAKIDLAQRLLFCPVEENGIKRIFSAHRYLAREAKRRVVQKYLKIKVLSSLTEITVV
nr:PtlJ [Pestalotiopsis rhododendri]